MFSFPLNETEYVYYSFKISARYVKNKWNKAEYIFTVKYMYLTLSHVSECKGLKYMCVSWTKGIILERGK